MKLPNWFKIAWWALLLVLTSLFLVLRYQNLRHGHVTPVDIVLFAAWAVFALVPILGGARFFGTELKQEIQELSLELKSQLLHLRSEIRHTEEHRREINLAPLADAELPALEKRIHVAIKRMIQEYGSRSQGTLSQQPSVDDYTQLLFEAGYSIEQELRRIAAVRLEIGTERNPHPTGEIIRALKECQLIDANLADVIRELCAICRSAILGRTPSEAQVQFVQNLSPGLLRVLRSIQ
jgi:hypothetical protein